jgi:hypothetical protein
MAEVRVSIWGFYFLVRIWGFYLEDGFLPKFRKIKYKNRNKSGCHVIRNALHEIKVDATSKQMIKKKNCSTLTSSPPSRRLQPSDTDLYSIDSSWRR